MRGRQDKAPVKKGQSAVSGLQWADMVIESISNEADYAQALALMDELIEDYDNQKPLSAP